MGHLLKQPFANETIGLSELGTAELILVYMSQFNNLPWRIPLCINEDFEGSFKITERVLSLPTSHYQRTECQRERKIYKDLFVKERYLPKSVYEIDNESALNISLTKIVHSKDKKALSKKFIEKLYSIKPSKDFEHNCVSAVSPYKSVKMDFWLAFKGEASIDTEKLFVYKKDLIHDLERTILQLIESCGSADEVKKFQRELIKRIEPNSLEHNFFPIAEALVSFTFKKKRLPYQNAIDRKQLWNLIVEAVSKFNSLSQIDSKTICYLANNNGDKVYINSESFSSDLKTTYYPKLLAELAVSLLPEEDDGF
ncbi:hypothetical protein [Alteromonas portus]|uniref:hypothetical protein n=1 Tax=Alteromonas portus TaxID=2565549 RepID=UPI003BF7D7E0